jgi:hypothetical protein
MRSANSTEINMDDSLLKSHLRLNSRGNLVGRFTPTQFVLEIDTIALSNKSLTSLSPASGRGAGQESIGNIISGDRTTVELTNDYLIDDYLIGEKTPISKQSTLIPKHFNIIHADQIIRDATVSESSYNTFWIYFLPFGGSSSNDNYYVNSIVVIDLGEKYKGVNLEGELSLTMVQKKDTEHIFSFDTLQPLELTSIFSNLIFSSDVGQAYIYTGNGADSFLMPADTIDLAGFENPTVNLSWDISDLVEIYDNNTPDNLDDDRVTFRLENPFPVDIKVVEQLPRGESLFVTLSDATTTTDSGSTLDVLKEQIKVVILDDDSLAGNGTVRFASNSVNTNEADGTVSLQVIREAGNANEISVHYSISSQNNTATAGSDFNNVSGDLTWIDEDMAPKYITIPITDDDSLETTEFFDVELSNGTNGTATISGWDKTRVNIYDNDTTTDLFTGLLFSQNYFYGVESDSSISIRLVRTGDPSGDVAVDVDSSGGLATKDVDFSASLETLAWNDGDMTSKTYQVFINDDTIPEPFREKSSDSSPPSEVYMLAARGGRYKTVLQWVNPADEDFKSTKIIRKQDSAPTSSNDGELIYDGYRPAFADITGITGVHYYYLIQTVDTSANVSNGVVVDRVQN